MVEPTGTGVPSLPLGPEECRTLTLPDGTPILLRTIRATDVAALQQFHGTLSSESIYRRFMDGMPELTDQQAIYFTHLDGLRRQAVVALNPAAPEEIIGVVRYDREVDTDRAEYAIAVADAWQHKGVGRCLTQQIIAEAVAHGIHRFLALVLPENRPMLALLNSLGWPVTNRWQDHIVELEITLT